VNAQVLLPTPRAVAWFESPVGPLIAAATTDALCLLEFSDAARLDSRLETLRRRHGARASFSQAIDDLRHQLDEYFKGRRREFTVPLVYPGTPFQERVWSTLREIRYGETWSYLDVAKRIGDVKATRAVGSANGENPIAIVIPCHRVVNASGDLGGYGGGLWRKRILLDLERGQHQLPL
jgi:AraC family transcriptional regulator of adaptative response/methylated-DNA-[protein]-cysteine methyltransferase